MTDKKYTTPDGIEIPFNNAYHGQGWDPYRPPAFEPCHVCGGKWDVWAPPTSAMGRAEWSLYHYCKGGCSDRVFKSVPA